MKKAILSLGFVLMLSISIFNTEASAAGGFSDVKSSDYFHDSVQWAVNNGITSGTSATTFSPNATCTRGQVATFLYAAAKGTPVQISNHFSDLSPSDYYYKPVLWAVKNGITSGTSNTTFSPNAGCTRGQVVMFLWRAAGSPEPKSTFNKFRDVAPSDYYFKAVLWAAERGITGGTSDTTFSPDMQCTRGQIVTFLNRYYASVHYTAAITLHNSSTHKRTETIGTSADLANIQAGTYPSFTLTLENNSTSALNVTEAYVIVDSGSPWGWKGFSLASGKSTYLHIYDVNMQKLLSPGTHTATWYINGSPVLTKEFTFTDSTQNATNSFWTDKFTFPTAAEISAYNNSGPQKRAPYLSAWLDISSTTRFTEYAVDFKADYLPLGSYGCVGQWQMDTTELKKTHTNVHTEYNGVGAYAGFQNTTPSQGTVSIMSFWDIYATAPNGKEITIRAKQIYPATDHGNEFGGEGVGVNCIAPYPWKEGNWYRILLQCSDSETTGNTVVTQWVCDLETETWTKLCAFDTGLKNSCFTGPIAVFLENYLKQYAGDVRSMELRNIKIRDAATNQWKNIESASVQQSQGAQNLGYNGTYAFGSENERFWFISSGTGSENGCIGTPAKRLTVTGSSQDKPY
ncbi:MAG: S-layer homology domain-containing protein [Oscillospiraceae bacterium]|nr:S-layer homology domain-containing protein [Oscillospiraceae bacterium]